MMNSIIPIIRCSDIERSVAFYIHVLDFELPDPDLSFKYVVLTREGARLDLSEHKGDGVFGSRVNILVTHIDSLFERLLSRGLKLPVKNDSPVHQHPVKQSWGTTDFYVDDPDGNTIRFIQPYL